MIQPTPPARNPLARALLFILRAVLSVFVLIDELLRPLYRPLTRWISQLALVARAEVAIGRLPPYGALALLAVPFAVAEPLKIWGLVLIAQGHFKAGLVVTGLAHLASFLVVERIYHAGRHKLLTIGWFAWGIALLVRVRDTVLDWIGAGGIVAAFRRLRAGLRAWWHRRGL